MEKKIKPAEEWTRKEFESLPFRKNWDTPIKCGSIVILPLKKLHDSGYRLLDFVAVDRKGMPICRLSGCSDVLNIDGISGFGKDWIKKYGGAPKLVPPSSWNIDCLPKSGLLRIFVGARDIEVGVAMSSFEIFAIEPNKQG